MIDLVIHNRNVENISQDELLRLVREVVGDKDGRLFITFEEYE